MPHPILITEHCIEATLWKSTPLSLFFPPSQSCPVKIQNGLSNVQWGFGRRDGYFVFSATE